MLADGPEQLADEAVRRPVGEPDASTLPADACEFRCRLFLVGREHDAECGQHGVEAAVGKRQRFGIGLLKGDVQSLGVGTLPGTLKSGRMLSNRVSF